MEQAPRYVAVFRDHPLGPGRYVKDFWRNLGDWNAPWWKTADEEQRLRHFEWSLNHHQYHYSTADLNLADCWDIEADKEDLAILEKYAPVDLIEVEMRFTEKDANGWQQWYWVIKEPA